MCDFNNSLSFALMNAANTALTIGGSAMKYMQGKKAVSEAISSENASFANSQAALAAQRAQANESANEQMGQRALQAKVDLARLRAANAESGLSGVTSDRLANEVSGNAGRDAAIMQINKVAMNDQFAREAAAQVAAHNSRLNQIKSNAPSMFGTGLEIASAGIGYLNRDQQYKYYQQRTK